MIGKQADEIDCCNWIASLRIVCSGANSAKRNRCGEARARAVEPHGTQAGFLFFDIEGVRQPLEGAHLYITGVRDANGTDLMFFDVPLEKYLSAGPK